MPNEAVSSKDSSNAGSQSKEECSLKRKSLDRRLRSAAASSASVRRKGRSISLSHDASAFDKEFLT